MQSVGMNHPLTDSFIPNFPLSLLYNQFSHMNDPSPNHKAGFSPLNIYGDIQRITRLFYFFAGLILVSISAGIIILLLSKDNLQAAFLGATLPLVFIGFVLISRKEFEKAAIFLAVILFLMITIVSTSGLGIHHISNFGFPAILIVASLVIRKRTLVFLTIFSIACVAWLVFWRTVGGIYTPHP
jgi:hypothetical protein